MQKRKYLSILVVLASSLYAMKGYTIETDAVITNEMGVQEPSQEAIDACAGKTVGNSCEYTKTGTKVAGVCQKGVNMLDETNSLICQ